MQTDPIVIPGVAAPVSVVSPLAGRPQVLVGGQQAHHMGRNVFALPGHGGQVVEAKVRARPVDPYPQLTVNGQQYTTGPKVPIGLQIVAGLPILLFIGGLIGILLGFAALLTNMFVLRSRLSSGAKVGLVIGVSAAVLVAYLAIATIVSAGLSQ